MTAEERAELREWVTASRRAQGLPDRISDPAVLARAREILRPSPVTASLPAPRPRQRPRPRAEAMLLSQQPERNTPLVARVPSDNNGGMPDER